MEEKQLEARESIELISRMIQNTRTRLERNAGRPFLIWGYTTVGISLLNYGFAITGVNSAWSLTWFLIPVIGCLLTWLFHEKRRSEPRTEIDRIVWMVWLPITLAQLDIKGDIPTKMRQVAEAACAEGETIHNMPGGVDSDQVYAALLVADQYGQRFLQEWE